MGAFGAFPFATELFGSGPPPTIFATRPIVAKVDLLAYIRVRLNDPNGLLWSDDLLLQLIGQAEVDYYNYINLYWIRFAIAITSGVGTYDLSVVVPSDFLVKHITRITYRGFKVDVISQKELTLMSPIYRDQQTRPRWATWQFDGFNILRLYPKPAEDLPILSIGTEIFNDINLLNECVISAYLFPTETNAQFTTPDYYVRRLTKYFVLWKAYAIEGPGQNTDIAKYFYGKYRKQIEMVLVANAKTYNNKERQYSDVAIQRPWKKHRPSLPPTFGTPVIF